MTLGDLIGLHGRTENDTMLSSWDVYVSDPAGSFTDRFVGFTEKEKTFSPALEYDELTVGIPEVLYSLAAKKADYSVKFSFQQVGDFRVLGLAMNGELDTTDPDNDVLFLGSNPPLPLGLEWRFVGQTIDGRPFQMVFLKGVIANPEELKVGTGSRVGIPVTVRAMVDPLVCDYQRNMVYFCVPKLTVPSGGFVDPCPDVIPDRCV